MIGLATGTVNCCQHPELELCQDPAYAKCQQEWRTGHPGELEIPSWVYLIGGGLVLVLIIRG